jgi:tripartite-type tricarboxylate transporter receptor subunit TctC
MRRLLLAFGILVVALSSPGSAQSASQAWPSKTIKVVVPLTPGSASDVMARIVFDQVSQSVGQPIVIENRPGAGNSIGMNAVAKAEPDGYTILVNSSTHTVSPAVRATMPLDTANDLAAIIPLGNMPVVILFNPSKGYKKLSDFVAWAKANPSKANYSSAGAGNSSHLNGELFRLAAGFDAVHLPFKGAPEAMTEVIAGRSDFYFSPLVNALPLMKDGQLQALAVSNSSRASALPDIPTIAEAGYPNSEYNFWAGVFVPAKTPASIKEKLYAEVVKALTAPSVRDKLKNLGADPLPLTSAQFDAQVRKEIETNSKIAKAAATSPQRLSSLAMRRASSSDPPSSGSTPCGRHAATTSLDFTASRSARESLSIASRGVPAGAIRPNQIAVSKSGMPDSIIVGTSGRMPGRLRPADANTLSLPSWTSEITAVAGENMTWTRPASRSVAACGLPG